MTPGLYYSFAVECDSQTHSKVIYGNFRIFSFRFFFLFWHPSYCLYDVLFPMLQFIQVQKCHCRNFWLFRFCFRCFVMWNWEVNIKEGKKVKEEKNLEFIFNKHHWNIFIFQSTLKKIKFNKICLINNKCKTQKKINPIFHSQ